MKEQEIRKQLAGKLREFRLRAGLTAKEVGEKIGKRDKTVSGWEHGRGQPDADMLFLLCEIYKIKSIAEFYSEEHEESAMPSLSADEQELVSLYRTLNAGTKGVVLATIRGFAGNPSMQKESTKSETA